MPALTKKDLDSVSRFLQALRMCGAVYRTMDKPTAIMPDGTAYAVAESKVSRELALKLPDAVITFTIRKDLSARATQIALLENHIKILRRFA